MPAVRAPTPSPPPPPAALARTGVDEGEYYVRPTHPIVAAGPVELDPANLGMDEHNLAVRDAQGRVLGTVAVDPGQTQTLTLSLHAGTYTLFCSLYNHEQLGMRSTLTVR
jgi:plastocyanin